MAATVKTNIFLGATPGDGEAIDPTYGNNVRFNLADNNAQTTENPCVKPDTGINRSFWKTIALHCSVAPDNYINNIKLYTDGVNDWDEGNDDLPVNVGLATNYVQAQADGPESGLELTQVNHAGLTGAPSSLFGYTSAAPLSVPAIGSGAGGDFVPADVPGRVTQYVVMQLSVKSTASGGTKSQQTLTWRYDEA